MGRLDLNIKKSFSAIIGFLILRGGNAKFLEGQRSKNKFWSITIAEVLKSHFSRFLNFQLQEEKGGKR